MNFMLCMFWFAISFFFLFLVKICVSLNFIDSLVLLYDFLLV